MLTKTIKHKDLDGNDTETVAHFNITKAEALELNIRQDLETVGQSKDRNELMDTWHRILGMAYGVRTADGEFVKVNDRGGRFYDRFRTTEAYSELFIELFTDQNFAIDFIKGILPAEVAENMPTESKSAVPEALRNHPSMQGHRQSQEQPQTRREAREQQPQTDQPAQTVSEQTGDPEYLEFLKFKREREEAQRQQTLASTPPAVSPETPQDDSLREGLV